MTDPDQDLADTTRQSSSPPPRGGVHARERERHVLMPFNQIAKQRLGQDAQSS